MTAILGRLAPGMTAKFNVALDVVLLIVTVLLTAHPSVDGWYGQESFPLAIAVCAAWVVVGMALRYYDPFTSRDALDDAALSTVLVMAITTLLAIVGAVVPDSAAVPSIGRFLLVFWPSILALRFFAFRPRFEQESPLDEVLIIGTGALGRCTATDLATKPGRRHVVGYLRFPCEPEAPALSAPLLGSAEDLEEILKTHPINEVYISGRTMSQGVAMQQAIKVCERFGVPFALPAPTFRFDRAQPSSRRLVQDGYLHYMSIDPKPHQMALKRMFDILSSAVALWALLPLFAAVSVLIKLTSRGPVLFKQVRVGLHGRQFHMLKFRSMVIDAEQLKEKLMAQNEQSGPVFKMKHDPRITAIGRFIRKYSIDELPQLINVLRGDMSVVGPRPPVPPEVAKYEPWQRRRLSVRPGLTCIWQVSGRNAISFEEWMYMDMRYVDNWSLGEDLSLILRTVPVVVTGRGAS